MIKLIKIALLGILFGITLSKAEIISWYRIYEMFHFHSFHMYGVIGSAVILGILAIQIIKKKHIKTFDGELPKLKNKEFSIARYLIGGILFGLGWALIGVCPGPMFILLGYGYLSILVVIISAIVGTFVYGILKDYLAH